MSARIFVSCECLCICIEWKLLIVWSVSLMLGFNSRTIPLQPLLIYDQSESRVL